MKSSVLAAAPTLGEQLANTGNKIVKGDATLGYYGRIEADKLIGIRALLALITLPGVDQNLDTSKWLKFSVNGKRLYVCDHIVRRNLTYNELSAAQLLLGKQIAISGKQYIVRSLDGGTTAAAALAASEWNKLMYPVCSDRPSGEAWDNIPYAELALISGVGATAIGGTFTKVKNYIRGYTTIATVSSFFDTIRYTTCGWRPVLEEV